MSGNTQLVPHIDTQTRLNRSFLFEKEVIASIEKKKKNRPKKDFLPVSRLDPLQKDAVLSSGAAWTHWGRERKQTRARLPLQRRASCLSVWGNLVWTPLTRKRSCLEFCTGSWLNPKASRFFLLFFKPECFLPTSLIHRFFFRNPNERFRFVFASKLTQRWKKERKVWIN